MIWYWITGVVLILLAGFFMRSFWERRHPVITSYTVSSPGLPEAFQGLRVVFLSDLHGDIYGEGQEKLIRMIGECSPDLLLFGGDMMTVKTWIQADYSALESILSAFFKKVPMYYGNGNHEMRMKEEFEKYPGWYEAFTELLSKYEVVYLSDCTSEYRKGAETLYISGLDLLKKSYHDGRKRPLPGGYIDKRLGEKKEGYQIVLCHSPQYLPEMSKWGADLVLSGHFHGGTIRIPGLGGVMTPQYQFFSKYTKGALKEGGTKEIVSAGLGTHSINIRFLNRPEIVLLTLERK